MKANTYLVLQSWMVTELELQGTDLMIYAMLYAFTIYGRGGYDGDMEHIAEWTGLSERTIKYSLSRMVERGLVERTLPSKGRNRTLYKTVANHAKSAYPNNATMQNLHTSHADIADQPCKICRPSINTIKGNIDNNSDIYIINNIPQSAAAELRDTITSESAKLPRVKPVLADLVKKYSNEFTEVWALYPRHVGKADALKAYAKARNNGTSKETIVEGVKAYAAYVRRECKEPEYILHGSTYFNQRRWEDDYGTPQTAAPQSFSSGNTEQDEALNRILWERQQARKAAQNETAE